MRHNEDMPLQMRPKKKPEIAMATAQKEAMAEQNIKIKIKAINSMLKQSGYQEIDIIVYPQFVLLLPGFYA